MKNVLSAHSDWLIALSIIIIIWDSLSQADLMRNADLYRESNFHVSAGTGLVIVGLSL